MLMVNPSKSCTMTIGSRAMTRGTKLKITINGSTLTETDCFKLLGIELDQNITWKNQISATAKKISSKTGLIRRLQNYLAYSYYSVMHPLYNHILITVLVFGVHALSLSLLKFKNCKIGQPGFLLKILNELFQAETFVKI